MGDGLREVRLRCCVVALLGRKGKEGGMVVNMRDQCVVS